MHLQDWAGAGGKRVHHGDGGMGPSGGIDDDGVGGLARFVNPVDQLELGVGLAEFDREAEFVSNPAAFGFHVGEGFASVDFRLAFAEQVQIWSIEDENGAGHQSAPG